MVGLLDDYSSSSDKTDVNHSAADLDKVTEILQEAARNIPGVERLDTLGRVTEGRSGYPVYLVQVIAGNPESRKKQLYDDMIHRITEYALLERILSELPSPPEAYTRLSSPADLPMRIQQLIEEYSDTEAHYRQLVTTVAHALNGDISIELFLSGVHGPHYLKIRELNSTDEYERFKRLLSSDAPIHTRFMSRPVAHTVVNQHLVLLYKPAHDSLSADAVCSLTQLGSRKGVEKIKQSIQSLADCLVDCFKAKQPEAPQTLHTLLTTILRDRRVHGSKSVFQRTTAMLISHFVESASIERVGKAHTLAVNGEILPNPVAYLQNRAYWNGTRRISAPMGVAHGDLHCENIICKLGDTQVKMPEVIDFDDSEEAAQSIFFDFLYLEFDLILREMKPSSTSDARQEISRLLRVLMAQVVPDEKHLPVDGYNLLVNHLLPLRQACLRLIEGDYREDYENAFWLTAVAVGLNYLRKESGNLKTEGRMLGWLYAAHALKKVLEFHGIAYSHGDEEPFLLPWVDGFSHAVSSQQQLEKAYLDTLIDRLDKFDLTHLTGTSEREAPLRLTDIYIPLQTQYQVTVDFADGRLHKYKLYEDANRRQKGAFHNGEEGETGSKAPKPPLQRTLDKDLAFAHEWEAYLQREWTGDTRRQRTIPVDVNLAAALAPHLIVSGVSGSGKSTVLRYLALRMVGKIRGDATFGTTRRDYLSFWPHAALLPVYVSFSALMNEIAPTPEHGVWQSDDELLFTENFRRYLSTQFTERLQPCINLITERLEAGQALLILDGVDEVVGFDQPERQKQIYAVLTGFRSVYPDCRIIVSTRADALANQWYPQEFVHVQLLRLGDEKKRLARNLFNAVGKDREVEDFLAWVSNVHEDITSIPLFFSLMMAIWLNGSLDASKLTTQSAVYRASVNILINRWHDRNGGSGSRLDKIGLNADQLRHLLEVLAFHTHSEASRGEDAEFESGRLMTLVRREFKKAVRVDYDVLVDSLARSGLIDAKGDETLKFTHRSFQEHLAASYLARDKHYPTVIKEAMTAKPQLWRHVINLLPDEVQIHGQDLWELIDLLLREAESSTKPDRADVTTQGYEAFFAVQMLENHSSPVYQRVKQCEQPRLRAVLQDLISAGRLTPPDRAAMGRLLAQYGDQRRGVGLAADGLPDIAWCAVPEGIACIGGPNATGKHRVREVGRFNISRYPITVAQFGAFVESGEYEKPAYWRDAPQRKAYDAPGNLASAPMNEPVVNINWYHADAFCRWLSEKLSVDGQRIRVMLPSESQWERAAEGLSERFDANGALTSPDYGNIAAAKIGRICAVGMFPKGESRHKVMDLLGNVNEWCQSAWRSTFDKAEDNNIDHDQKRVVRGGAFISEIAEGLIPRTSLSFISHRTEAKTTGFRVVTLAEVPTINKDERTTQVATVTVK